MGRTQKPPEPSTLAALQSTATPARRYPGTDSENLAPLQFLRLPEVEKLTGLKRSQIYLLQSRGTFPKCIKLGKRASAWIAGEVNGWLLERIAASRPDAGK
jgi:prophage regulatory protein